MSDQAPEALTHNVRQSMAERLRRTIFEIGGPEYVQKIRELISTQQISAPTEAERRVGHLAGLGLRTLEQQNDAPKPDRPVITMADLAHAVATDPAWARRAEIERKRKHAVDLLHNLIVREGAIGVVMADGQVATWNDPQLSLLTDLVKSIHHLEDEDDA